MEKGHANYFGMQVGMHGEGLKRRLASLVGRWDLGRMLGLGPKKTNKMKINT